VLLVPRGQPFRVLGLEKDAAYASDLFHKLFGLQTRAFFEISRGIYETSVSACSRNGVEYVLSRRGRCLQTCVEEIAGNYLGLGTLWRA
jgi:hypothetical protein